MRLTILGAGVAGLATGHYARQRGLPFSIFEAAARVGGNAATLRHGEFLFDTGAHRLHDRFSQVTEEVKRLLGDNLHRVAAPSQIYSGGRFVNFPLTPFNLLKTLGPRRVVRAAREVIASRVGHPSVGPDLASTACAAYGATLAELFLLTYSEKLWGIPSRDLSNDAAGRRIDR